MIGTPGLETIKGLVGSPPAEIALPRKVVAKQQTLMEEWNRCFIAIIPYCYKCKQPLVWYIPPDQEELFVCPGCGRVWVKGEGWSSEPKTSEKGEKGGEL